MKKILPFFCLISLSVFAQNFPTKGSIERLSPEIDAILPQNAKIEVLASGFRWAEGPVWVKDHLLFTDVPQNTIFKWSEANGLEIFLKPSGYTGIGFYCNEPGANGLTINKKGNLVACEHGDRRVSEMPLSGGGKITLADRWQGKRFNSPNDITQHSSGAYYFTDPPYGLPRQEADSLREIPAFGVYRIATDGVVNQVIADLSRPNGICFSPDEKTMYVAQSDNNNQAFIFAYDVQADGSLKNKRIFFDGNPYVKKGYVGAFDGLKADKKGNLFATGPGGVWVLSSSGKPLGRIDTQEPTANCAIGKDGYLYITANKYLCRIKLK